MWAREGACRPKKRPNGSVDYSTSLFFNKFDDVGNPRVEHNRPDRIAKAKAICRECPVRDDCLVWALRHGVHFDFLAGEHTWSERKRLLHAIRWWARAQNKVVRYPWHSQDMEEVEDGDVRDSGQPLAATG